MSVRAIGAALRGALPEPDEVAPPQPRLEPPEAIRLTPLAPMPARTHGGLALAPRTDARTLALLDASVARLVDLDALARTLRPDVAEALGPRLEAVRALALEVRARLADRALLESVRHAVLPA